MKFKVTAHYIGNGGVTLKVVVNHDDVATIMTRLHEHHKSSAFDHWCTVVAVDDDKPVTPNWRELMNERWAVK